MEKIYKYPVTPSQLFVGLPIVGLVIVLGTMSLMASRNLEDLPDRLFASGFGFFLLLISLWWLVLGFMRRIGAINVTVSDQQLRINNVLSAQSFNWDEITEFGTYRRLSGRIFIRVYYVKTKNETDRQIHVCNEFLDNINEFIDVVFQKARNARFSCVENIACIPFARKLRITRWDRDGKTAS
jgi:hypothetical protein